MKNKILSLNNLFKKITDLKKKIRKLFCAMESLIYYT